MSDYKEITKCRCCPNEDLYEVLDLGEQPLANSFRHSDEQLASYPLKIMVCTNCWHSQLSIVVNPDIMFKNYLYVSGTSQTLKEYFRKFAYMVRSMNPEAQSVLEIASNDGSQLDSLRELGFETYGVDPARNLCPTAASKGHNIFCDYWGEDVVEKLNRKFDMIIAQNVLAHTDDILSFLKNCERVINENGRIYIQTSQCNWLLKGEFDYWYHEHVSNFTTRSMLSLLEDTTLFIENVIQTDIHGDSYLFILTKQRSNNEQVLQIIDKETSEGRYDLVTYQNFAQKAKNKVLAFKTEVEKERAKGQKIIGYGAAAKANTFLNFAQIKLDGIIDDNPLKQGLLSPGMNIPIINSSILRNYESKNKLTIVPLAWNFFDEIQRKVMSINRDVKFLRY